MSTATTTRVRRPAIAAAAVSLAAGAIVAIPATAFAADATTTTLEVKSTTIAYGEVTTATATVDTVAKGTKPAGTVTFTIDGEKVTVALDNSGKATVELPLADASSTPYNATAVFTPTDANAFASSTSAPVAVTVNKDETTTEAVAIHKKAQRKLIGKATVTSAHGQTPDGKVKFIAKRNGKRIGWEVVELNDMGKAKAKFTKVPKKGTYKIVAKYKGSDNFLKSKDVAEVA